MMKNFMYSFLSVFIGVDINGDPVLIDAHASVFFIYIIFLLMLIYFNYYLIRFISLKNKEKIIFLEQNKVVVDFLINYSVAVGVMGTLVSIGVAFSHSGADIADTISQYFGTALLTTVVGIVLYGYFFLCQAILSVWESKIRHHEE